MALKLFALAVLASCLGAASADAHARHGAHRQHLNRMASNETHIGKRSFSGEASWYDTETGNAGHCGDMISNKDWAVAIAPSQFKMEDCGKRIRIHYKGKTAEAVIKDSCPPCFFGKIDLSRGLFEHLDSLDVGILKIDWEYIDGNSEPPKQEPPKQEPPKEEPPKWEPPKWEPPKEEPPKQEPPKEEPPKQEPPKEEPPKQEPTTTTSSAPAASSTPAIVKDPVTGRRTRQKCVPKKTEGEL